MLEDLTSNETASISSLDDLEFSADDFITKDKEPTVNTAPDLDDIESIEDFDDSQLEEALGDFDPDASDDNKVSDELDDMPGLGDWLGGDDKSDKLPKNERDSDVLDELEDSSFDEMLESIDLEDELSEGEQDTGFDITTLLDETETPDQVEENNEDQDDDFLDVEALLNESDDAESDNELSQALDLDVPLEPFVSEQESLEMVDVDADQGLGAKLDLAHAYIEIGEEDSAKELLDEIIKKGTEKQIAEAQAILDEMG